MLLPTGDMIRAAATRLHGVVIRTPLVRSAGLSEIAGVDVYLKCENLQRTGSFKLRGAYNALSTLSEAQRVAGVVASSAGNHGMGVAYAARVLGVRALIYVPANAPAVKRDGIVALGGKIDASQPHYDAAHHAAIEHAAEHGMPFVNPCGGIPLLAGQGTVGLEIIEELPSVQMLVVPVGGAGLVGGIGALLRSEHPGVRIIGAQSECTNAMARSLSAGRRVDVEVPPTLADGLAGQIDDEGFAIGRATIDAMSVITETELAGAIAWLAHEHALRVEGSGAVGVAAVMRGLAVPRGPVVVVISGGNIDDERFLTLTRSG